MKRWRPRPQPVLAFGLLSAGLHAAAFRMLDRPVESPSLAFEPAEAAATLSGDTLEVEMASEMPPETDDLDRPGPRWPGPAAAGPPSAPAGGARATATPWGTSGHATVFGAVGVRFATDLATTFTRAFPQAASADPAWGGSDFGAAGWVDVTLVLNAEGHIANTAIAGNPSRALRHGVERTLALIGPRTFTARDAVTMIRVTARVTRDDIHDGLHGDVFALSGGSFSGDLGTAFFALPRAEGPGRRVDVQLRLVAPAPLPR